jgi:hypothetical protein
MPGWQAQSADRIAARELLALHPGLTQSQARAAFRLGLDRCRDRPRRLRYFAGPIEEMAAVSATVAERWLRLRNLLAVEAGGDNP